MELELFLILALIVLFLISCCGLLQKIRENYEEDRGRVISVTQIHVPNQMYNNVYHGGDEMSSGVFPGSISPPPYAEHLEPPPRYEDLDKDGQYTIIQMPLPTSSTTPPIYTTQSDTVGAQGAEQHTQPSRTTVAH